MSPHNPQLIDSGATDHMISSASLLSIYIPPLKLYDGALSDGSKVLAIGKGSVFVNISLALQDVMLVPSFPTCLTRSMNFVLLDLIKLPLLLHVVIFQDTKTKKEIGHGLNDGSLYYLWSPTHESSTAIHGNSMPTALE